MFESNMKKSKVSYLILILFCAIVAKGYQEIILQRCLPKADMENVAIKCGMNEVIAIKEAFFTSSIVDQCPFVSTANETKNTKSELKLLNHINNNQISCTDDLRLTLNSKCSGQSACSVNLRKLHLHQCSGHDGWINLKYACVIKSKVNSYCNIQLTDSFGYVSNPGYPKFYPQYDCKWKIIGYPGQRVQIEILDLSLKEPKFTSKKINQYECSDNVAIIDNDVKLFNLCGETKSNLIEYRSKSNEIIIEFQSYDFSPTRGLLFRYSMVDCPTLKPPSNGYMYRNQSYAFYNCYFDYVFEDTGLQSKVLFCEYESYWNGSVARCIAKENITSVEKAYALSHSSINNTPIIEEIDETIIRPITLIIVGVISLCIILTIIGMLIHSNRNYITNISI